MNITLLGHDDIASLFALDRLMALLPEHHYSAFLSAIPKPANNSGSSLEQLATADARLCEQFLAGELGDPAHAAITEPRVVRLEKPNSADGLRVLRTSMPDLIVSIRYRRILRDDAIAIPRFGVLNLHSGILPDYRGVMATFWAMLNREAEIGTTLHWIVDPGIDTGPVIGIRRRTRDPRRSYLASVLGLYTDGCEMLATAIASVAAGESPPTTEQSAPGQYFHAPGESDVQQFEAAGMQLIDHSEGAEIRALR